MWRVISDKVIVIPHRLQCGVPSRTRKTGLLPCKRIGWEVIAQSRGVLPESLWRHGPRAIKGDARSYVEVLCETS